jgi:uncharacterized protein (DUF433 family)
LSRRGSAVSRPPIRPHDVFFDPLERRKKRRQNIRRSSKDLPDVCGGRPCVRGLRIRVKDMLELLAGGASREEILADLEDEDVTAVLQFAARQNDHPVLGRV